MIFKHFSFLLIFVSFFIFSGCEGPILFGPTVKKEYFPNGKLESEFIITDKKQMSGILKRYGPDGELTSTVPMRNGVKNGIEKLYDQEGRILKTTPYVNGKKQGDEKGYFPNGDIWFSLPYQDGVLNGDAYIYTQDGKVLHHAIYKNGIITDQLL